MTTSSSIFILLLFLLVVFPISQSFNLLDVRQKFITIQNYENYETKNFDISKILQRLMALKTPKFYQQQFSRYNFAGDADSPFPDLSNINITTECLEDMVLIGGAILNPNGTSPELAAVLSQMLDAMAKEPPGLQRLPQNIYGFKQECDIIKYSVPNRKREFKTAYSRAYIGIPDCSSNGTLLGFDICMPNSCSSKDLETVVTILPQLSPNLTDISTFICKITTFDDVNHPMETGSWIMISFLIILATLVIAAGITDYFLLPFDTPLRQKLGVQLFISFSGYTSVCEIMKATKSKRGQIGPINCLRVMSMFWVILGHTVGMGIMGYTNNLLDVLKIQENFFMQFIENGFFSVDTFFFIGGVLLSFMWFKNYNKDKKKLMSPQGWIMFYVHRIIRLSAPYWVTLWTYTYLFGPITQNMPFLLTPVQPKENACTKYIWQNMFYMFNIDATKECLGHTWYLATDIQMFILTPIILIPLAIQPIIGWIVAIALLILSTAANVVTVYIDKFPPTYSVTGPNPMDADKFMIYIKTIYYAMWIRCQVYIMGLLLGWFLQKYQRIRINVLLNLLLWSISTALMLTVVLGLYHYFQGHELPIFWRAAYSALSKPAWALGLTWILVSCYYGYGGPINQFMSWNIWVPLGRLSYCAYLVHYPLITYVYGLEKNAIYYSSLWQILINFYIPIVVLSFALALVLSVLVEVPVGKLEALLLRPPTRENRLKETKDTKDDAPSWEIKNGDIETKITKEITTFEIIQNGDLETHTKSDNIHL